MQNYRFGEIVLLKFPFVEQQEAKRRPALVLLDAGDADILAARITSRATLEKRLVERKLGVLTHKEMLNVQAKLQKIWMSI